jgi:hypothetical protein
MVEVSERRDHKGVCVDPTRLVPDGLRLGARFTGSVVDGELAGAMVRGVDDVRFRRYGVGMLDVRDVPVRGSDCVEVRAGGHPIPPARVALPLPGVMLSPSWLVL